MTGFSQPERRGLARSQSAQAHPDADLLNAFSEQTLTAREREQVLAHLAVCSACREVVSLAAAPMEETVPEPVREASAWKWPVLRWGAVAASAAIVVIAVALGIFQNTEPPMKQVATETAPMSIPAPETQKAITAQAPASTGMKAPQVRYEKVPPKPEEQLAARADAPSSNIVLNRMNAPLGTSVHGSAMGGVVAGAQMRTAKENESEAKKDQRVLADTISNDRDALAKLKTAPPPPPSPGVPAKSAALPPPASETVTVQSAAPAVDTASATQSSAEMVPMSRHADTLQKAAPMVARDMRMNTQTLDQRWQVTPDGYLLSSTDEGKNWVRQLPDLRFTHVQTIGMHVWASGPEGILMHSIDGGMNWNKVIPTDSKATLQGDITSIVFTDITHGTIGTSKGETWTTSDAGKTWKKQ